MKVFISWSEDLSHRVAVILREWLPNVIQAVEPYVSSEDLDKGSRWFADIAKELEDSQFGIICLTRENLAAPWILFEAGAISKKLDQSRVAPLLINLTPSELKGPLVQFQATTISEADLLKLIKAINHSQKDKLLNDSQLEKIFYKWWPDLKQSVDEAIKESSISLSEEKSRDQNDILEEVLGLTRAIAQKLSRTFPDTETIKTLLPHHGTGKSNYAWWLLLDNLRSAEREDNNRLMNELIRKVWRETKEKEVEGSIEGISIQELREALDNETEDADEE